MNKYLIITLFIFALQSCTKDKSCDTFNPIGTWNTHRTTLNEFYAYHPMMGGSFDDYETQILANGLYINHYPDNTNDTLRWYVDTLEMKMLIFDDNLSETPISFWSTPDSIRKMYFENIEYNHDYQKWLYTYNHWGTLIPAYNLEFRRK